MKVYVYVNDQGVPFVGALELMKTIVLEDCCVEDSEKPVWTSHEDEVRLHVVGRFAPVARLYERYV